jgi:hypothetical protein
MSGVLSLFTAHDGGTVTRNGPGAHGFARQYVVAS